MTWVNQFEANTTVTIITNLHVITNKRWIMDDGSNHFFSI